MEDGHNSKITGSFSEENRRAHLFPWTKLAGDSPLTSQHPPEILFLPFKTGGDDMTPDREESANARVIF